VGVDVNRGNLQIRLAAQELCRIYGLPAKFLCVSATDPHKRFSQGAYGALWKHPTAYGGSMATPQACRSLNWLKRFA
jgi:hypothetical protein